MAEEKNEGLINEFLLETLDKMEELDEKAEMICKGELDSELIGLIFRAIHSIKGGGRMFVSLKKEYKNMFEEVLNFCHEFETFMDMLRKGKLHPNVKIGAAIYAGIEAVHARFLILTDQLAEPPDFTALQKRFDLIAHPETAISLPSPGNLFICIQRKEYLVFSLKETLTGYVGSYMLEFQIAKEIRKKDPGLILLDLRWLELPTFTIGSIIHNLRDFFSGKILVTNLSEFLQKRFAQMGYQDMFLTEEP